ncbi:MAG TPA: DUF515 domain-containing protein [Euryarchaeota archaeon]|nr:hypothetical protein BMS3Bbin15_01389 [archaeon BMS3Bbin15]HDL14763.1 DUF515 domain-containing protein [Euryarchaeota archaeon]
MYYAKATGSEDDIVGRLEALRRRAPPGGKEGGKPEKVKPVRPPDDRKRKRMYRIVGLGVIAIVLLGLFFVGYTKVIKPMKQKEVVVNIKQEQATQLILQGQKIVRGRIMATFSGLPPAYKTGEKTLFEQVDKARSIDELKAIDYKTAADIAWREYLTSRLSEKYKGAQAIGATVVLKVGTHSINGYREALAALSTLSYTALKTAYVEEIGNVYVPVLLSREQAAGGFLMPGDSVNIYYTYKGNTTAIVKNARVIAYMMATASISLSENENRIVSGQGGGAKGEGTISTGGVASLKGPISIGMKQSSSSMRYSVNLEEVEKAAAAGKLNQGYMEDVLSNYGIKLTKIEIESQIGNFNQQYIVLLEMNGDEATNLISKTSSSVDRKNIQLALSKPSSWMSR